jgi:hypothetical protein
MNMPVHQRNIVIWAENNQTPVDPDGSELADLRKNGLG